MQGSGFKLTCKLGHGCRQLRARLGVRPQEVRPVLWSALCAFCLSSAYYVLRPIRDTMGIAGGVQNLTWLFSATLLCMLLVSLSYSVIFSRLSWQCGISVSYRIFIANLLIFACLLQYSLPKQDAWIGYVFFVWVSVFSLFTMSIFWMLVVDVFNEEQGKRLFGLVAAGANLGALAGSGLSTGLARLLDPGWTLVIAAVLLEAVIWSARCLRLGASELHERGGEINRQDKEKRSKVCANRTSDRDASLPGKRAILPDIAQAVRSSYVMGICIYVLLFSVSSTALYFHQAELVQRLFPSDKDRTNFFASTDLAVNVLTLLAQLLLTSRVMHRFGIPSVLAIVPLLSVMGFSVLAWAPTITVLIVFRVMFRVSSFAFAKPAQEVLFTVVKKETKYKVKNFIDTVINRAGDQLGAWVYAGMGALGLSLGTISFAMIPLTVFWLLDGVWLGRRQEKLAAAQSNKNSVP